jgi:hypothetical protein
MTCATILILSIAIQGKGRTQVIIWEDNFEDGNLEGWMVNGMHYNVSTEVYTPWNGTASATSGKLQFESGNHWTEWQAEGVAHVMNITRCWHPNTTKFGQWSFDVYPGAYNMIAFDFLIHFSNPEVIPDNIEDPDFNYRYSLYILNGTYKANYTGRAFIHGNFESPDDSVTVENFTGKPCFIFFKEKVDQPQTVFVLKEFTPDIIAAEKLSIQITRDSSSKFSFYVNNKSLFSVKDPTPIIMDHDPEGYYFVIFSFGGSSWVDNIVISDTIPVTESTSEAGFVPLIMSWIILVVFRRKPKN